MRQIYYVTILVVRPHASGPEILLARRAPGRYMGGTWQLISGGLDLGETAWQGALREMREETGLQPTELYRLSTLTRFYRADNDSLNTAPMFCALVEPDAVVRINPEHTAFEWIAIGQAASRLMWPADREAVGEVQTVILAHAPAREHLRIPI